jgi:hypothetical protein
MQGSRYRAIRGKKSPCEGQLHFLIGQEGSSSSLVIFNSHSITGFDINGCPIARGKWNASSGKWKRHPTCPMGQVKIILWYVQFLKSKMINIEFSVGSRGEFHLNNASYILSCILRHFVLFCWLWNSPFSNKDRVIYFSQSRMPNCRAASTSYLFSPANEKLELFAVF